MNKYIEIAAKCHADTNHMYAKYIPYRFHLELATRFAQTYIKTLELDEVSENSILCAVAFHDSVEDARLTMNDLVQIVKSNFPEVDSGMTANLVYAVTNEKGWTRKDRANEKYYSELRKTGYATFVKLCDKLANAYFSAMFDSPQRDMHKKEWNKFVKELQVPRNAENIQYTEMFEHLRYLTFDYQIGNYIKKSILN